MVNHRSYSMYFHKNDLDNTSELQARSCMQKHAFYKEKTPIDI